MNQRQPYSNVAPFGGVLLMGGWLALGFLWCDNSYRSYSTYVIWSYNMFITLSPTGLCTCCLL
jgi:hypothetical protein